TAYAGDIIGIYDSGNFQIGDTLTNGKDIVFFEPLPTFPPELFSRVSPINSLKGKNFQKGVEQLAQEGAIQVYRNEYNEVILGAVGVLQFEVFNYRLVNEYNTDIRMENIEFTVARWVKTDNPESLKKYQNSRCMLVFDHYERPVLLFTNLYALRSFKDRYEDVELVEALDVVDELHDMVI
ncbi:MAG: peptide chain release factor 3, partial [Tissierellia bacterium]|nr:peptide chain release factor 3 [Tissierellia bacterium]